MGVWCLVLSGLASVSLAADISIRPGDDIYALTASLGAGDTIVFQDGVHELDGTLTWADALGEEGSPVVITTALNADVTLRQNSGGWIIELRDSSWVEIDGLVLEGGDGWETGGFGGLRVNSSEHVTVTNVEIRQTSGTAFRVDGNVRSLLATEMHIHDVSEGHGLEAGCSDASCFVEDSVFTENWIHDILWDSGDAIRLLNGSQAVEISDTIVHDIGDDGIYLGSTEFGPPNRILANALWNLGDVGMFVEGSCLIQNNILVGMGGYGIETNNSDRDALDDVVISHNTVAEVGLDGVYLDDVSLRSGIVFANNAIANPLGYGLRYDPDWSETEPNSNYVRNNMVTGLVRDFPEDMLLDAVLAGGGYTDFIDPLGLNLYPTATSLLINVADASGEANVPTVDFNGTARDGESPDIGALEWSGAENPAGALEPGFKADTVVPANGPSDLPTGCCAGKQDSSESQAAWLLPLFTLALLRRRRDRSSE